MGKTKRTYQPSKRRRSRQGFLSRGKRVLARRRRRGRTRLAPGA